MNDKTVRIILNLLILQAAIYPLDIKSINYKTLFFGCFIGYFLAHSTNFFPLTPHQFNKKLTNCYDNCQNAIDSLFNSCPLYYSNNSNQREIFELTTKLAKCNLENKKL